MIFFTSQQMILINSFVYIKSIKNIQNSNFFVTTSQQHKVESNVLSKFCVCKLYISYYMSEADWYIKYWITIVCKL